MEMSSYISNFAIVKLLGLSVLLIAFCGLHNVDGHELLDCYSYTTTTYSHETFSGGDASCWDDDERKAFCEMMNREQVIPYLKSRTYFSWFVDNKVESAGEPDLWVVHSNAESTHPDYVKGFECICSKKNFLLKPNALQLGERFLAIVKDQNLKQRPEGMPDLEDA